MPQIGQNTQLHGIGPAKSIRKDTSARGSQRDFIRRNWEAISVRIGKNAFFFVAGEALGPAGPIINRRVMVLWLSDGVWAISNRQV